MMAGKFIQSKKVKIEKIKENKKHKVIITFVEELNVAEEESLIRDFGKNCSAFSFWGNKEEDIYHDYLISSKKQMITGTLFLFYFRFPFNKNKDKYSRDFQNPSALGGAGRPNLHFKANF